MIHNFQALTVNSQLAANPSQSIKLPLAFTNTVILGTGPHQEPWPFFCSVQTFTCFEMGPPLQEEEGSVYYWLLSLYWGVACY
jgi:hypothetical protein